MAEEEKRKGGSVVNAVWPLAEELATSLGLTLWDVLYVKEGARRYLRIVIDKPGGVNIDDCVALHEAIDAPLDELDPIPESYNLQVSSAGIERELKRDFHFAAYLGRPVILKLRSAYNEKKLWNCTLAGYDKGNVTVAFPDGETHTFEKKEYISVKLDDFEDF